MYKLFTHSQLHLNCYYLKEFLSTFLYFTMADEATFRLALERCGLVQGVARDAVVGQGYESMLGFRALTEDDIDHFVKAVNKLPQPAVGQPRPQINFASIKKLKAMRNWTVERERIGLPLVHDEFTDEESQRILARMDEEAQFSVNKPVAPPLPEKFTSFGPKWREFSEGLKGHCGSVRGCMNIPLAYLLREVDPPTPEMLAAVYDTTDERLMALVRLAGPEYQQDNKRLWELMCPLIRGTAAWEYVKNFERTSDGRRAFRVLQLRGEGEAAIDARRTKAEATLAKAQYTGKSKRFTLQSYINLLQGAFNDLEECGDPYGERKKVDTFIKGLVADRFAVVRATIMGDPLKRGDFQLAYGYVETMENLRSTTEGTGDGFDRNVSAVGVDANKKGGGKKNVAYIPPAEWAKMSAEERKKVQSERDRKKNKKTKKGPKQDGDLKRKLAEMAAEVLRDADDKHGNDSDDGNSGGDKKKKGKGGSGPQDQFGRNVHSLVKFARDVATELGKDDRE